ncbi:MAG: malectin, partial [Candidatus Omnitrophica bacterium]|nr:malectin [Candidatus Omnitrophota bacterium]
RTGQDLMEQGIVIEQQAPGELVYLNLPNRPGSGTDTEPPLAPGRVLARRESNIGYLGVGIYWSPGSDNNWISYYEVRRGAQVLGKVSYGTYFFDHFPGWNPTADYAVRTIDGDGNASPWMSSQTMPDEPLVASALGAHFSDQGREGWRSETTTDNETFTPMTFIPPVKDPAGNSGGTGKQIGGVEGYWEGAGTARTGRGWQQASTSARCVRSWTAPMAGHVRIIGRAAKEYYRRKLGGPLQVCILHNDRQIWPAEDWAVVPVDDLHGVSHDISIGVAYGDCIRFVLDSGNSPENDVIAWMPRIVYDTPEPVDPSPTVVRILCGSAEPYVDSLGVTWPADRFFSGGTPMSTTNSILVSPSLLSDAALYRFGRQGNDFTYSIPVKPGLYTVRLKFAEPEYQWFFQRPFNLSINGRQVMRNADICQSARGWRRAHDRIFRYVVPDGEGRIVLRFTGGFDPLQKTSQPMVQAIDVLPEIKPAIRIDTGSETPFVDWNSLLWNADSHFQGGHIITSEMPVSQASPTLYDQRLYQTARAGKEFSYTVTVPPGLYSVHLKFAELWLAKPGQRPMNIEINGVRLWENWDPAAAAEQLGMAADIRTDDVTPDRDGRIMIRVIAAGENEAVLQGIEIE